jgi:hypothetical protein
MWAVPAVGKTGVWPPQPTPNSALQRTRPAVALRGYAQVTLGGPGR